MATTIGVVLTNPDQAVLTKDMVLTTPTGERFTVSEIEFYYGVWES